jgi:hypothetical protein
MNKKNHLVLIRGGAQAMGPISRLRLWNRFPSPSKGQLYLMLSAKVLLAATVIYFLYAV